MITGDVSAHNYSTDLYQVGVLLYELMVGTRPFTGAEHEVMNMQINSPVPIENVSHAGIAQIIKKAMNKSQSDRYNSAAQFKADIENCDLLKVDEPLVSPSNWGIWVSLYVICVLIGVLLGIFI